MAQSIGWIATLQPWPKALCAFILAQSWDLRRPLESWKWQSPAKSSSDPSTRSTLMHQTLKRKAERGKRGRGCTQLDERRSTRAPPCTKCQTARGRVPNSLWKTKSRYATWSLFHFCAHSQIDSWLSAACEHHQWQAKNEALTALIP